MRDVHAEAKQRLAKAQGELSLVGLERKRRWPEHSLAAGRMV